LAVILRGTECRSRAKSISQSVRCPAIVAIDRPPRHHAQSPRWARQSGKTPHAPLWAHNQRVAAPSICNRPGIEPSCPWWSQVRERLTSRRVRECEFISGDIMNVRGLAAERHDRAPQRHQRSACAPRHHHLPAAFHTDLLLHFTCTAAPRFQLYLLRRTITRTSGRPLRSLASCGHAADPRQRVVL
jgi:hypothetical protein